MKISSVALLAFVGFDRAYPVSSFLTPQSAHVAPVGTGARSLVVEMAAESDESSSDVSIPYDSPAEVAYKGWLEKYDKPYDAERYKVFLSNYKAITVMNVSAKKKARENPDNGKASLLSLNEYADFTGEEYEAAMNGGSKASESASDDSSRKIDEPASSGNILGEAVKAVESQASASSALQEAADALEAEEEKLAAQLGLGSAEELEDAMDFLEGIDSEGVQMDDGDLAREARIRAAYMDWCKDFNKESDEIRFKQFFKNVLEMEEFSKETGKEMVLNEFADFTEDEYSAMQNDETVVTEEKKKPEVTEDKEAEAAKVEAEAAKVEAEAAKVEAEAAAIAKQEAKRKAEEEEIAEAARQAALTDVERRAKIEKEKAARQSAQAKELEKAAAAREAEAIAAQKMLSEDQAGKALEARSIMDRAADLARAKAKEWDDMQAKVTEGKQDVARLPNKPPPINAPPAPTSKPRPTLSIFNSLLGSPSNGGKTKDLDSKEPAASEPRPTFSLKGLLGDSPKPTAPTPAPTPAPKPAPKAAAQEPKNDAPRPTLSLLSLFESKPSAPKPPAPKPPAPKPPAPKPPSPKPTPKPAKKEPATQLFSFNKPAPKKLQTSKKAPAPTFSFFGSKPAPAPAPPPAPAPAPAPAPSFSFFGSKPTPPKKAPAPAPAPAPSPAPSFSFFGKKPSPKKAPAPAPAPAPLKKPAPSFFSFGSKPAKKPVAEPAKKPVAASASSGFSLFGGSKKSKPAPAKKAPSKKAIPKDNIPVITNWKQNSDGSITGRVSNSDDFRTGTKITTSPVKKGAKGGGIVVRTGSGSRYRLM